MGRFLNPDYSAFQDVLDSKIYVDKTELLEYTNSVINTTSKFICNSRPRRFGKSITANMMTAYYSKGCDSKQMFSELKISKKDSYEENLNKYDVIHFDVQWCIEPAGSVEKVVSFITENVINELRVTFPDICPKENITLPDMLSRIYDATGRKFIVIIDEWDVLIRDEANNQRVQEEYIKFLRGMFKGVEPTKYIALAYLTGTYESIIPLINKNFDGLKTAVIAMISGDEVNVRTATFQNDMITFRNKDDVLTLLVHLGYLAYNQKRQTAYIPNEEIRMEFIDAVEDNKWSELIEFEKQSEQLLEATLDKDAVAVSEYIGKIHTEYASTVQYNNENSLSSVLTIAYLSAMKYYFKPVRELPTGRGFADFVLIPKPEYATDYPALIIELKWNQNVQTAMKQIKDREYPQSILHYTGNMLLVGINYDKKSKEHECVIETYEKI